MSQPNDRVRTHIKALLDEAKHQAAEAPAPAQMFFSGMLSGLAASVEIHDGGTAEKSMELMVQRLSAAIGQAYLDGKLPAQPPTTDGPATDADRPLTRDEEIRGVQGWMAMDIHQALGWDINGGEPYQGRKSWADWWAELCAEVRKLARKPASPATAVTAVGTPVTTTNPDTCRHLEVDGQTIRVRGAGEFTEQEKEFAAEIVRAAKRKYAAERPEPGRSAETDMQRVIDLYEQWVKAGRPPLGTSVSRWWDARLVELREAVLGAKDSS